MCSTPLTADNVRWDLSSMYKGIDDEAIHLDLAEVVLRMQRFESEFKGKLTIRLPDAMTEYLEIEMSVLLELRQSIRLQGHTVIIVQVIDAPYCVALAQ